MNRSVRIASATVLVALVGCGTQSTTPRPAPSGSATASASPVLPSPSPTPTASPAPSLVPSPSATQAPAGPPAGFGTATVAGGSAKVVTDVASVRFGQHPGYDRFVVDFSGDIPEYSVSVQPTSRFTRSPRGTEVVLQGTGGVLIRMFSIGNWNSYNLATHMTPGYPYLREAELVENFEGVQQWGLGIAGAPAVRVMVLSGPSRLVVDIAAS